MRESGECSDRRTREFPDTGRRQLKQGTLAPPHPAVHSVGLKSSRGHPFAAVIHQDMCLSLLAHRFLHQVRDVFPHLWEFFRNLRVRLRAFLRLRTTS